MMLNDREAARFLGLAPQTLRNWRSQGKGPSYVKIGNAVRYRMEDLEKYIQSRRINLEHEFCVPEASKE
ncbi:MAG TPA: DNA-binding protein [Deltaproteobacteria bacterium]|nr:DNA-binding protein [Deltaproteobacteria bacterium]